MRYTYHRHIVYTHDAKLARRIFTPTAIDRLKHAVGLHAWMLDASGEVSYRHSCVICGKEA